MTALLYNIIKKPYIQDLLYIYIYYYILCIISYNKHYFNVFSIIFIHKLQRI